MVIKRYKFDFIKNTIFSSLAEFSSFFIFIFAILVARTLGPSHYGIFIFAISFGTIYSLFIRFGFLDYLRREIPVDQERGKSIFRKALTLQILLLIVSSLIIVPICLFLPKPAYDKTIVLIISGAMIFQAFKSTLRGVLRGLDHFQRDAVIVLNERLAILFFGFLVYVYKFDLLTIALGFLLVRVVDFLISLIIVAQVVVPRFEYDRALFLHILKAAWPFAMMIFLFMVYNYSDSVMISFIRTDNEVGFYSVAYQIIEGSQLFPSSLCGSLLPLMTLNYISNMNYVNSLFNFSMRIMFFMAFPLCLFCTIFAPDIVLFLYGEAFSPAIPALQLIIWGTIFLFLSTLARTAFYAAKKEKLYAVIFTASVLFNIVLNIPFIYWLGFIGACITTILTEFLVCVFLYLFSKKLSYRLSIMKEIRTPLILNVFMAFILITLKHFNTNFILVGIICCLFYGGIIYLGKFITIEDFRVLRGRYETL